MSDSEKLDLILSKLVGIEDRLGITEQRRRDEWAKMQRQLEIQRLPVDEQNRLKDLANRFDQSWL